MSPAHRFGADGGNNFQVLWEDGDCVFCQTWRRGRRWQAARRTGRSGRRGTAGAGDPGSPGARIWVEGRAGWRVGGAAAGVGPRRRPDHAGARGSRRRAAGSAARRADGGGSVLRLAIAIAAALAQVHRRGLVHKDIKPYNILVNSATGEVGSPASASPRCCRANARRPSRPRPSPARSPTWRPSRPAG